MGANARSRRHCCADARSTLILAVSSAVGVAPIHFGVAHTEDSISLCAKIQPEGFVPPRGRIVESRLIALLWFALSTATASYPLTLHRSPFFLVYFRSTGFCNFACPRSTETNFPARSVRRSARRLRRPVRMYSILLLYAHLQPAAVILWPCKASTTKAALRLFQAIQKVQRNHHVRQRRHCRLPSVKTIAGIREFQGFADGELGAYARACPGCTV